MPPLVALHFTFLLASGTGYTVFSPVSRGGAPLLAIRARACVRASETDDGHDQPAADAEDKRRKAQRLALQAEKAALELERLELQASEFRRERATSDQKEQAQANMEQLPTAAPPAPAAAPAPTATNEETAEDAQMPFLDGLLSSLNASDAAAPATTPSGSSIAQALSANVVSESALQLSEGQVTAARERVFGLDTFYVSGVEQTFIGTIFRGNLKGSNASVAFARVLANAAAEPELSDTTFLLIQDPLAPTMEDLQTERERSPVFLAIPSEAARLRQGLGEYGVGLVLAAVASITTLGYALSTYILSDGGAMLAQMQAGDATPIGVAVPIAVGLVGLQFLHEVAHFAAARVHSLRTGFPLIVPSLQLGFFGAITRLLAFPKNRTALFDFAFAGPAAAGVVGFALYLVGIGLSVDLPIPPMASVTDAAAAASEAAVAAAAVAPSGSADLMPVVPSALLQSSLLLGSIAEAALPALASSPAVAVHPLVVIGFTTCLVNALQLLPIGRLDGGRMAAAVLGSELSSLLSGIALLLLGFSTIFGGDDPILLFFGLLVIFVQVRSYMHLLPIAWLPRRPLRKASL